MSAPARKPREWFAREVEVRYGPRRLPVAAADRSLRSPSDVAAACADLEARPVEVFRVLLLDGRHRLAGWSDVSVGSLTASLVHPREVFALALERRAAAIILVHNHPSGDPGPSAEDRQITARLAKVGALVGIEILDHVVIGAGTFASAREGGWLS